MSSPKVNVSRASVKSVESDKGGHESKIIRFIVIFGND
jgi:hypothetical protein